MKNQYYLIRHGHSLAQEKGIIVSSPSIGITNYGLSSLGKKQAESAGQSLLHLKSPFIISSDFLRARETAEIIAKILNYPNSIQLEPSLRERFFGDFEGLDNDKYEKIWEIDRQNPPHPPHQVESCSAVQNRIAKFITKLEQKYYEQDFILVSHGDTLAIAETFFQNFVASNFLKILPFRNAEIRHYPQ
ncbi:MAG TPA: histidine phosphatase family protein [Candidatus Gracilibacteria bacterium]|nr:histidine phosphatase family protein [Candidatus Gracilibacteria bacterium]